MRILAAFAFACSAQAFACPQLSGTYTCNKSDGSSEVMTLKQDTQNAVTIYDINGSRVPADKAVYPIPDDANIKNGTFHAWCDDDVTLKIQVIGKYWDNGSYFGDLTVNMNFSLSGTDLHQLTVGEIVTPTTKYPLNSDMVCSKNH